MKLPIFQDPSQSFMLMQSRWSAILNLLTANPLSSGIILRDVSLISGTTQVNHLLGRKLQGWFLTRVRAAATIYDSQDSNPTPELTLSVVSNAAVVVDIYVF